MDKLDVQDVRDALENMLKDLSDLCSAHYDTSLFWKMETEDAFNPESRPMYQSVCDSYRNSAAGIAAARIVVKEWVGVINSNLDNIVLENRDNGC